MNQNHNMNKLRNVALATILAAGVVGPTYVATADTANSSSSSAVTSTSAISSTSSDSSVDSLLNSLKSDNSADSTIPSKDETVYVFAKADGSVKNTIVSDWLKNVTKDKSLNDVSNLTDIQNTEGDQTYTTTGGNKLSWQANGSDIYYQGNTTQQAPVTVKVTYTLDGKTVSPDEIAGKSGKVKIRFDYTNNSTQQATIDGVQQTIYTPFVAMTGLVLDNSNFTNIEVTNGKSMNDGDRTEIAGYAMPGMQTDLNLSKDKIDVPDYVEISADATNFKLATTATVVTNSIFNKVDTSNIDSSNVQSSMDKLSSAMTQLIDGSSDLYDGLQQLADGTGTLDSGVGELQDKTASLPDSSTKLANGSASLAQGLISAVDGSSQLNDGATQVYDGLNEMKNGTDTTTGLKDAVTSIGDTSTPGTLRYGSNALVQGLQLLRNGDGTASNPGLVGAQAGAYQLSQSLSDTSTFDGAIAQLQQGTGGTNQYLTGASSALGSSAAGAQLSGAEQSLKAVTSGDTTNLTPAQLAAIQQAETLLNSTTGAQATVSGAKSAVDTANGINTNVDNGLTGLKTSTDTSLGQASAGATQIYDGLTAAVNAIDNTASPTSTLLYAAKSVDGGLNVLENGGTLASGKSSKGLVGAVDALGDKSTSGTLLYGAAQLAGGSASLESGLSSASDGANQIADGTQQLADATPALVSGISALKSGSKQLNSGTITARDGSLTLSNGLKEFNDEGVSKIVDAYNNNLKGLSSRVTAISDASKKYDTFSGKSDAMKGEVKFIYETDSIGD